MEAIKTNLTKALYEATPNCTHAVLTDTDTRTCTHNPIMEDTSRSSL